MRDVAPLSSGDTSGSGLFFLLVLCTVGGYLSMTVVEQVLPTAPRPRKLGIAVAVAVLTPPIAFAAVSLSAGAFGAGFGAVVATLGVAMIYTMVVELLALLFTELVGQASIFLIVLFLLAGDFPSAGGSAPESMLPPFWQAIHAIWFGSGAMETFRSLIFFGGDGFAWPFVRLLMWFVAVGAVLAAVAVSKGRTERAAAADDDPEAIGSAPSGTAAPALAVM